MESKIPPTPSHQQKQEIKVLRCPFLKGGLGLLDTMVEGAPRVWSRVHIARSFVKGISTNITLNLINRIFFCVPHSVSFTICHLHCGIYIFTSTMRDIHNNYTVSFGIEIVAFESFNYQQCETQCE